MTPKDRIIQLQKQLSIATKALQRFKDGDYSSMFVEASDALDEIERIQNLKLGMKP